MENLAKAILAVMDEVKGIEKNTTVGNGYTSYKGVSDKDVKIKLGAAMHKHGLVIIPTGITSKVEVNRYEEVTKDGSKQKQVVFTEVVTSYTLMHSSGENIAMTGYGHGVDSQDKGAGKATTYALKNALLYLFMVPTGHTDDTDTTHSDDLPIPTAAKKSAMEVMQLIEDAKTLTDLANIYNQNSHLHKDESVIASLGSKKKELTPKAESKP